MCLVLKHKLTKKSVVSECELKIHFCELKIHFFVKKDQILKCCCWLQVCNINSVRFVVWTCTLHINVELSAWAQYSVHFFILTFLVQEIEQWFSETRKSLLEANSILQCDSYLWQNVKCRIVILFVLQWCNL